MTTMRYGCAALLNGSIIFDTKKLHYALLFATATIPKIKIRAA
jgi:hypothetical protein